MYFLNHKLMAEWFSTGLEEHLGWDNLEYTGFVVSIEFAMEGLRGISETVFLQSS